MSRDDIIDRLHADSAALRARLEKAEKLLRRDWHARSCRCQDCRDRRAFLAAQPVPGEPK